MSFTAIVFIIILVAAWVVGANFIISIIGFVAAWVVVVGVLTTVAIVGGYITHLIEPAESM